MEGEIKNLFVLVAIDKASQLKKTGRNFSIEKFTAKEDQITVVIAAAEKKKRFNLSVKGETFYLENKEEQPLAMEDMVTNLFILANGGQEIPGLLVLPVSSGKEEEVFEEEEFPYVSPIIPT